MPNPNHPPVDKAKQKKSPVKPTKTANDPVGKTDVLRAQGTERCWARWYLQGRKTALMGSQNDFIKRSSVIIKSTLFRVLGIC